MTENALNSLSFFFLFCNIIFTHHNIFFIAFSSKNRKTKQIIITFITTTLKTLLSVAKAKGRLSWHKFDTGNVCYLFLNTLPHISPISIKKGAQPKLRTEKCKLRLLSHKLIETEYFSHTQIRGACIFTKSINLSMLKKGYIIP